MFRIKICGVTNLDDAHAAAEAGADAVGLNFFNKSRRFVEPTAAQQIAATLPTTITKVGVFVNHGVGQIAETVERVGLDAVQLHGDEPPALIAKLPTNVLVILAHRCGHDGLAPLQRYLDACRQGGRLPDALLIDADAASEFGGTGQLADWSTIGRDRHWFAALPLILAGGLTPDNVAAAIAAVKPDAVDVASGVESAPGRKDPTLVARFVSAARQSLPIP